MASIGLLDAGDECALLFLAHYSFTELVRIVKRLLVDQFDAMVVLPLE
jgi:hypothetical protein